MIAMLGASVYHIPFDAKSRVLIWSRLLAETVLFSAVYGFSIGRVHSLNFALRNLVKFPALILVTGVFCSLGYFVFSKLIARGLSFDDVQQLSLRTFRDISLMLASLAPVSWFLALTIKQPDLTGLNEYPLFLCLNLIFISVSGGVALGRRAAGLIQRFHLSRKAGALIITAWLLISLTLGAQAAWYLRPFFGVSTIPAENTPFMLGRRPDIRGAASFYEAVYYLVNPPPLNQHYYRYRW
jgi:hypothetical protein